MQFSQFWKKDKYLQFFICTVDFRKFAKWSFGGTHTNCKYLSFSKIGPIHLIRRKKGLHFEKNSI